MQVIPNPVRERWVHIRPLFHRLYTYRAQVSISLVVSLALIATGQLRETVIVNAEFLALRLSSWFDGSEPGAFTVGGLNLGEVFFPRLTFQDLARTTWPALAIALLPVWLTVLARARYAYARTPVEAPGRMITGICYLPLLAFILTVASFARDPATPQDYVFVYWLLAALGVVCGILAVWLDRLARGGDGRRASKIYGVLIAAVGLVAVFAPSWLGQLLGPLPVLVLFAAALAAIANTIGWIEDETGIPVTILALVWVGLVSFYDWNDNHEIQLIEAPVPDHAGAPQKQFAASPGGAAQVESLFRAWLECRPGYAGPEATGEPYTVYLAAAQGGGLYAAYQSAVLLADLQDQNPQFASKVFALSGVSGGAVGASVFASLVSEQGAPVPASDGRCGRPTSAPELSPGRNVRMVRAVLRQDFLSPMGAALLFPDLLARFSPVPVPSADRARAAERAFARSFDAALEMEGLSPNGGLRNSVLSHWAPEGDAPMLLLNTTDVSTGTRMIASSPLTAFPSGRAITFAQMMGCRAGQADCKAPSVATAMLLSARFPVISPAGAVKLPPCTGQRTHREYCDATPDGPRPKARFVDGGYYENSGLDTVADLLDVLMPLEQELGVEFVVLHFDLALPGEPVRSYGLGELLSPLRTFNNARSARILPARDRVRDHVGTNLIPFSLDIRERGYTLGWLLATETFCRMEYDLAVDLPCEVEITAREGEQAFVRNENSVNRSVIIADNDPLRSLEGLLEVRGDPAKLPSLMQQMDIRSKGF
ncbi:hypothetical protein ACW9UR_06430 [Halovulum sp. GXIMD14794]